MDARLRELIAALPKAETHLHIEGAAPWAMVRARASEALPVEPPWWAEHFRFDDFTRFRGAVRTCSERVLTDAGSYGAVAAALFARLQAEGVRYVELSFDGELATRRGVRPPDVPAAIKTAAPAGLAVRVFGSFSQHKAGVLTEADVHDVLDAPDLDGIDLHGDETFQTAPRFAAVFAEARRRGLATKAHAGELMGPASVRTALDVLGVRRIEHGVRAVEDDELVDRLARERVTLDMCPWSNVRLRVWPDFVSHPIRHLRERGVRVTVSTDDPTVFGRTLTEELSALVAARLLSPADVAGVQVTAFENALVDAGQRAVLIEAVRRAAAAWPR